MANFSNVCKILPKIDLTGFHSKVSGTGITWNSVPTVTSQSFGPRWIRIECLDCYWDPTWWPESETPSSSFWRKPKLFWSLFSLSPLHSIFYPKPDPKACLYLLELPSGHEIFYLPDGADRVLVGRCQTEHGYTVYCMSSKTWPLDGTTCHFGSESQTNILTPYLTICTRSLGPLYTVRYYIKWVKTSWTCSMIY